jgi:hypothetical protein
VAKDKSRQYAYTDLSQDQTLVLVIEGEAYEVSQLTMTFALNEVPRATCLLAVGRNARFTPQLAKIHETGIQLSQMKPARLELRPNGEWRPQSDQEWTGPELIFDGYYVGLACRKVSNRVQAVVHLVHWLVDLGFSSTLDKNSHPSNPTSLTVSSSVPGMDTGLEGPPIFVSHLVAHEAIESKVRTDLWGGIKALLCGLAEKEKMDIKCSAAGLGPGDKTINTRAQLALRRIQGPGGNCGLAYDPEMGGLPLKLNDQDGQGISIPLVKEAVAEAVTHQTLQNFAHTTFWDAITGVYAPMFSLAIVPQVDTATVIASTPALDQTYDKEILPGEYEDFDLTGMIDRPLQGVAVYGDYESLTGWEQTEPGQGDTVCIGGQYAADAEEPGDGMWLVVRSPPWLRGVPTAGLYTGTTTGVVNYTASNTSTTVDVNALDPPDPLPGTILRKLRSLYDAYAHTIYVANMLRGRGATISGKLRFDIAPGSIVKIVGEPEQFAGGEDKLTFDLYGHVVRVTININAESQRAGTTLQLSHIRTLKEFATDERTKVTGHPLFGPDVYKGAPLVKNWKFAENA